MTNSTKASSKADYLNRIGRVVTHVHNNLDEPLDLDKLAEIACMSRFHWHRVYSAMMDETLAQTVKRLRLTRAAGDLANTARSISEISKRAGYSSDAAFNRAFSDSYGMPPVSYRETGSHSKLIQAAADKNTTAYPIEIRELPEHYALVAHQFGSYMGINKAFGTLFNTLGQQGLIDTIIGSYGLFFDDPDSVAEDDLRAAAVALFAEPQESVGPLEPSTIGGGQYATLRHTGPYANMRAAYDWMFAVWLPESGLEPRDAPILEAYLNDPVETKPVDLLSEILLPVEG